MARMQAEKKSLPSRRWLWIGGTPWIKKEQNFSGAYNCTSTNLVDWKAFGIMMDLAMMGCGTGAVIDPHLINRLPIVLNPIKINYRASRECKCHAKNEPSIGLIFFQSKKH